MFLTRSTDRLPAAHTCFNQLDLPAYEVDLSSSSNTNVISICSLTILTCRPMTSCAPTCWRRSKSVPRVSALPNLAQECPVRFLANLPNFDFPCWSGQSAVWSSDRGHKSWSQQSWYGEENPFIQEEKEPSFLAFTIWKLFLIAFSQIGGYVRTEHCK